MRHTTVEIVRENEMKRRSAADAIVLPFWQEKKHAVPACGFAEYRSLYEPPIHSEDFHGKEGETMLLYPSHGKDKRVILLGLGSKKKVTAETLRQAYCHAAKILLKKKCRSVNLPLFDGKEAAHAICEGILLSNYRFDQLKGQSAKNEDPTHLLTRLCLIGADSKELEACQRAATIIQAVNFTRDLVNRNADDVTPAELANCAKHLAKEFTSIKTTVLDKKHLEKEKMGLLLAVSRGAACDPALIIVEYRGHPSSKEQTALVGKGITYDTGGLNIKMTGQMETMKCDMAGAASVLGTIRAAAALKLKVNLIGVIASAENAIGPHSYKPGDVYTSRLGKTVEISNTDAEGRLVLADALTYVQQKYTVARIIDLATLTGGIIIALGEEATGLFSNDDALAEKLMRAGDKTFERVWRLPLYPEFKEALKSPIADLRNSGGKKASSATAAMFLKQFIEEDTPWAHLDIAGTAYLSESKPYHPTLATGVGVRLLIAFFESLHA